jgi:hypothetical protein
MGMTAAAYPSRYPDQKAENVRIGDLASKGSMENARYD